MKKRAVLLGALMMSLMALTSVVYGSPACKNTCGMTAVMYPFGTTKGCGSKAFQNYTKCSNGKFYFITNKGKYEVIHIDYANSVIIVSDSKMSTCSAMGRTSTGFGLQEGTPFTVQGPHIVLLACIKPTSTVQTSGICDPNGAHVCQSLYAYCPSVTNLGLSMNSAIESCCLLTEKSMVGSPIGSFGIDPAKYGCLSYTSIFRFGPGFGYGDSGSSDYRNPNTWSYGIALHYTFDLASYSPACRACEASHGSCAFDDNSNFVCECPSGLNVTSQCPPGTQSNQATTITNFAQALCIRVIIYFIFVSLLLIMS